MFSEILVGPADGTGSRSAGPFAFISPRHPFSPHIERFRRLLADDARHDALIRAVMAEEGAHVRTLMRGRLASNDTWTLRWLYQSFQCRDETRPLGFRAVTLLYSASKGRLTGYEFPDDPHLTTAAPFFDTRARRPDGPTADRILRYIPRRRLTFRSVGLDDTGATIIGKFMRPGELSQAWDRLVKVSQAVSGSAATFSTAAPLGVDDRQHVFFQEAKPGQPLAALLDAGNVNHLLRRVGGLHRDVHDLQVSDVPGWDPGTFVQALREHASWIAFFQPDHAGLLDDVLALLLARRPRIESRDFAFCHGDFRCSQILKDGDRWSVIDFDGGMWADPYLEIAHVLAFLKYDVPWCMRRFEARDDLALEAACDAYLSGYQERASRGLDRRRLTWYRIGCEIHGLARMIKRDLAHPAMLAAGIELVRRLSEQLRMESA